MDIAPDLASVALAALLLAAAALLVSNNYIGKRWYYYSSLSKNTVYESHLENIDNIGCIVFFVTLISGLTFLITAVFILNIFKLIAVGTLISERPYRDLEAYPVDSGYSFTHFSAVALACDRQGTPAVRSTIPSWQQKSPAVSGLENGGETSCDRHLSQRDKPCDLQIGFWIYDKCRGLYVIGRLGRFFCPKFHR